MRSQVRSKRVAAPIAVGTVRVSKAEVSRERILNAAAALFAEQGYAGTTMREVAKRVGFQAASLYYHYPSKEALIEAVLALGIDVVTASVRDVVQALPSEASARERIEAAIAAHLLCVISYGDYSLASRRVLGQVPVHVRRRLVALRDAYSDLWLELLQAARATGDLQENVDLPLARTFILGALNSVLDWYRPDGRPPEEIAAQFAILVGGVFRRARS